MRYTKETFELIRKTKRGLDVARELFNEEHFDFSISRAYYAMFYCAEALLLSKGLSFSKHSAVISFFGKEFVKTSIMPKRLHESIRQAFEARGLSDYDTIPIDKEVCEEILTGAKEFLDETTKYLRVNTRDET